MPEASVPATVPAIYVRFTGMLVVRAVPAKSAMFTLTLWLRLSIGARMFTLSTPANGVKANAPAMAYISIGTLPNWSPVLLYP
jgi:hypothetical protein